MCGSCKGRLNLACVHLYYELDLGEKSFIKKCNAIKPNSQGLS